MILKDIYDFKWVLGRKIMIPTDYLHCCVIGCHGNHCCIWLEHNMRDFGGGGDLSYFKTSISQ